MKAIATTTIGLEDFTIEEFMQLGAKGGEILTRGKVIIEFDSIEELIKFNYLSRLSNRISLLLKVFTYRIDKKGLQDIYREVYELELEYWLDEKTTFAVRCSRRGEQEFRSPDVERVAGQAIIDGFLKKSGRRPPVNLEDPDTIVRIELLPKGEGFITIDFTGYEGLHMRGYRVYMHPAPIKTTIASALITISNWEPSKTFIDPMMGGGTIPIEAGMKALNIPPQYLRKDKLIMRRLKPLRDFDFDSFFYRIDSSIDWGRELRILGSDRFKKHVEGARKNAKMLKLDEKLQFFKLNVRNLSKRVGEVDTIVTNPPYGLRIANPVEVKRVYEDFMREASKILKEDGVIVLLSPRDDFIEPSASNYGFRYNFKRKIEYGKLPVFIYRYRRG